MCGCSLHGYYQKCIVIVVVVVVVVVIVVIVVVGAPLFLQKIKITGAISFFQ